MGIGNAPFYTSQKIDPQAPPSPPFASNSADNGLSVDPVTGRIVFGNDVGDVAMPAQLLSDREIATLGFQGRMVDFVPASSQLTYGDQRVQLDNLVTGANVFMELNGTAPQIQINAPAGQDANFSLTGQALASSIIMQSNGMRPFANWTNPTGNMQAELVLGVLKILSANGTGNGVNIDATANDVGSTGTLSTADPGSGSGKWKLGTVVAGAVVPDPNNYVEVDIAGIGIVKLIKAV